VKDCVTRYNNPGLANPIWAGTEHALLVNGLWYVDPTWQAGAGKWVETDRVTIDGMQSYGNHSVGIWFDYNNTNVIIRNSVVHDNLPVRPGAWWEGTGISIELCTGPVLVENNTLSSHSGPNLIVQSSRNVTVRNNTINGGYLAVQDWPRGANYTTQDVTVTDNRFNNGAYAWAEGGTWNTSSPTTKRISFDYNRWESRGGDLFRWGTTSYRTLAQVQTSLGYERNGTYVRL
jgi:parallel beta-helix repeat protein